MSITSVDTDYANLTITLIADFDAPVDQVWSLWSDPRKLEQWWGPPAHPATFEKHDLTPGATSTYYMTGPDGAMWGLWRIRAVDPPISLEFINAYADRDGTPLLEMPVFTVSVRLTERQGGTRMEVHERFESAEQMERMVKMGTVDGLQQAVGQIDRLLATHAR
jgi:uncharacterized protein YndB with AHSA1/START domain